MKSRTPGAAPGAPAVRRRGPKHARPPRFSRGARATVALTAAVAIGAVVAVVTAGGDRRLTGTAEGAHGTHGTSTSPLPPAPVFAAQPDWTTLSNPASGLSYQIPPTGWSTNPQVGSVGSLSLGQGAERAGYTCGIPLERLIRGELGSGSAPRIDPAGLAESVAQAAATQYYSTGGTPPQVSVGPAAPVQRRTARGQTLHGVFVTATVGQHADPCLATRGEVLVFVLQFPDHDAVLLVNADTGGGPASPPPATDRELRAIVGTATPTS